jgi:hypothetical protein
MSQRASFELTSPAVDAPPAIGLIEVSIEGPEFCRNGFVAEVAPSDIRVEINEPLALGSPARFHLTSVYYDFETIIEGMVHWQVRRNDRYLAGVFLTQPLSEEILARCWSDTRRETRYTGCCHVEVVTEHGSIRGLLVNYSRSGLLIQMRQVIALNQVLTIRTRQYSVRCIVRWSTDDSECGHLIGCERLGGDGDEIVRMISGCMVRE